MITHYFLNNMSDQSFLKSQRCHIFMNGWSNISTTTYVDNVGVHSLPRSARSRATALQHAPAPPPQSPRRLYHVPAITAAARSHLGYSRPGSLPQSPQRPDSTSLDPSAPAPCRNHRSGQIRPRPTHGTRPSYPRPPKSALDPPSLTERAASIFTTPPPPPRTHSVHQAE